MHARGSPSTTYVARCRTGRSRGGPNPSRCDRRPAALLAPTRRSPESRSHCTEGTTSATHQSHVNLSPFRAAKRPSPRTRWLGGAGTGRRYWIERKKFGSGRGSSESQGTGGSANGLDRKTPALRPPFPLQDSRIRFFTQLAHLLRAGAHLRRVVRSPSPRHLAVLEEARRRGTGRAKPGRSPRSTPQGHGVRQFRSCATRAGWLTAGDGAPSLRRRRFTPSVFSSPASVGRSSRDNSPRYATWSR